MPEGDYIPAGEWCIRSVFISELCSFRKLCWILDMVSVMLPSHPGFRKRRRDQLNILFLGGCVKSEDSECIPKGHDFFAFIPQTRSPFLGFSRTALLPSRPDLYPMPFSATPLWRCTVCLSPCLFHPPPACLACYEPGWRNGGNMESKICSSFW